MFADPMQKHSDQLSRARDVARAGGNFGRKKKCPRQSKLDL